MYWERNAHVVVSFATESLSKTIPEALVVLGISTAGFLLAYLFYRLGDCITYRRKDISPEHEAMLKEYRQRTRFRRGAVIRTICMLLALASILIGLTIAFNAAGFNFWTIALGGGFIGIVVTYSFGSSLQAMMAYILINISEKIEEGWLISIVGMPVKGRVESIHLLWVVLVVWDEKEKKDIEYQVPTQVILSSIITRHLDLSGDVHNKMKEHQELLQTRIRV